MNIQDIASAAGVDFADVGSKVGLPPDQTQSAMAALLPMVLGGMKREAAGGDIGRVESLAGDVGRPADAQTTGNAILGQIFGSKEVSREVAGRAAKTTPGISDGVMKMLLPIVAAAVGKALTKRLGGGASAASGTSAGAGAGGIGGLLGALDADGDGNPMDDIMGMFGRK